MKASKKAHQIIKKLDEFEELFNYFMMNTSQFKEIQSNIQDIRNYIEDISLESKEHNARLAKKLKSVWDRENS